jgi:DNA-binding MarR family transcriptional regulator
MSSRRSRSVAGLDGMEGKFAARSDAAAGAISLGPLPTFIGYSLRRAQLQVFEVFTQLMSQFELTPGQFSVLIVIGENPGLRATDVCNVLSVQKANFAPLIQHLERRGLVRRRPAPSDKRTQSLQLTAAGRRLLDRAMEVHTQYEHSLISKLGPAAARRLVEQLQELARPA